MNMLHKLSSDENGFIVSAELVLVGTILVLGMIVGLTELSYGVNEELEDLGKKPPLVHCANSAAALKRMGAHLDLLRIGIAMYGLAPSSETKLPPVIRPALVPAASEKLPPAAPTLSALF